MLRRKTRWFRRLAAGLAFATLAAPAAAKNDEGGAQAGAGRQVIPYLSHGLTAADANYGNYEAMTHRQLEELANTRAIGNGDPLTHRQIEELAAQGANTFVQGVTDFPKAVEVQAPKVINYLSQGLTAADAVDPSVKMDNLGTFGDAPEQVSPSILGELVKSRPQAVATRPDDRADRFAHSSVQAPATVTDGDSGITWDGALTVGIGAIVAALALALGFGLVRRPKIAV